MFKYANVLVPRPLARALTYSIPSDMAVELGYRVLVPLGKKKMCTGIVVMMHDNEPQGYQVKPITAVLDIYPIIRHPQLKFWEWIASYYLCTTGEVFKAAVPAGLKVESETFISPNPDFEEDVPGELSDREKVVLDATASRGRVQLDEISRATGFKNVESIASKLIDKGAVHIAERVVDNYRPKTETCVKLAINRGDNDALHELFNKVGRAKKQETMLLAYLDLSHWMQHNAPLAEVSKDELLKRSGCTQAVLAAARARGIFEIYKKEINRFAMLGSKRADLPTLSSEQQRAYNEIQHTFTQFKTTLLHGVTSSGKTSIYMHLINDALKQGLQVLYLVPEIALTTQLTQRLRAVFGDQLLIYHSKFSDNERVDIWKQLLRSNTPCVVIGVRSAVFLPFSKLGLVIVDEEHDSSYKQQDPAPRYNGRNAALVLAQMHGAHTLLGSATPAIETYYNAQQGKYGLVKLLTRYEDIKMPNVEVIDTGKAWKKHEMKGMFSTQLIDLSQKALNSGQQVIFFQNRRGYSPMVRCKECGWIPKCIHCDVTLTYHKRVNTLTCHYCGYTIPLPDVCPVCKLPGIEVVGYGTERIEDEIEKTFPNERISRMDLDTTRNKNSYDRIINEFSARKTNILVGTQMVTKGLDFDGVSVVGILNADSIINFPDFRSSERAFDMLEQVSGRAGRAHGQGQVVIQTHEPSHPVISFVTSHDYNGFFDHELAEREKFHYPPFAKIINIYLKHRDDNTLVEMSVRYSNMLRQVFGPRVLGPEAPMVARVQNLYIRQIVLKMENQASMPKVKKILQRIYEEMLHADSRMRATRLYYDVDPM